MTPPAIKFSGGGRAPASSRLRDVWAVLERWPRRELIISGGTLALLLPGANPSLGASFRDPLADGRPCPTCPELLVAPAGQFIMGSPPSEPERVAGETQVPVSIHRPFAAGRFAVTFDEWDACTAEGGCNGYRPNDFGWGRGKLPVIGVSWDDAQSYVSWLSAKTGKAYRLLSEAEREYVARAGTTTPFWWGSSISTDQANYNGDYTYLGGGSKGEYRKRALPVDSFGANPWGFYQVHGNVWEWTQDCWADGNEGNPGDGVARSPDDCGRRVVRGGSWYNLASWVRAARRHWYGAAIRLPVVGFRVARPLEP